MAWEVAQGLCVGASLSIVACGPQGGQGALHICAGVTPAIVNAPALTLC